MLIIRHHKDDSVSTLVFVLADTNPENKTFPCSVSMKGDGCVVAFCFPRRAFSHSPAQYFQGGLIQRQRPATVLITLSYKHVL